MPRVSYGLRVGISTAIALVLIAGPLRALAATTTSVFTVATIPTVFITELQTTGGTASEEFIEFYNATDHAIDFEDTAGGGKDIWKLQFFSAASVSNGTPDWTKPSATASLKFAIPAHDYYILSATGYAPSGIDADATYGARMSDSGGGVQLVDVATSGSTITTSTHDRVMWKQVATGQTLPKGVMATPPNKGSLQRLPNDDSEYVNMDNALTDLASETSISPKDAWTVPTPTDPGSDGSSATPPPDSGTVNPGSDGSGTPLSPPDNTGLTAPVITELLPNPAAPLTDEADEYIELYNPNETAYNLKGYTLEVGTTTLHDFTFTEDLVIPAGSYRAFYSADTHLSLSNSGGGARLLGPTGDKLSESNVYGAIDDGKAWAVSDGIWQWTTTPTPGAANIITTPAAASKTAATVPKVAVKKATAKTVSAKVKGVSTTKTKKAAKPKKAKASTIKPAVNTAKVTTGTPIHTSILVAVAILALLYGAYEYRHDLANKFYQLRQYRAARRTSGK